MNFNLFVESAFEPVVLLAVVAGLLFLVILGVVVYEIFRGVRILYRIRRHRPINLCYGWMQGQKIVRLDLVEGLPRCLLLAVLYQEDVHFYQHWGFQYRELIRSVLCTLRNRRMKGGSSISQQTVKLLCFRPYRKFGTLEYVRRWYKKLEEIPLTMLLELWFSKSEILSVYLDSANWGTHIIGVSDAANLIHRKSPDNLDMAESIFLATMLMNPSRSRVIERTNDFSRGGYARELYNRSLLIQRTLDGMGSEPIESLAICSPYEFERRASSDACLESARIERATELVHKSWGIATDYISRWDYMYPVHTTFLSEVQRIALALIFGRRQFTLGEGGVSCDAGLLSSATIIAGRLLTKGSSKIALAGFPWALETELQRARDRDGRLCNHVANCLKGVLNACQKSDIDVLCRVYLQFNIPVYQADNDAGVLSIELLVKSGNADALDEILQHHQKQSNGDTVSLRMVPLSAENFAEKRCRFQRREIGGVTLIVPDPLNELLLLSRQYIQTGVQDWGQLAVLVALVNSIDPKGLVMFCGALKNRREREEVMVLLGLCSQFTLYALPRTSYMLPRDSRLSKPFMRRSYRKLFSQLEWVSQGV